MGSLDFRAFIDAAHDYGTIDAAQVGGGGVMGFVFTMAAMIGVFYFVVWRPERKRQTDHNTMLASVKKGDDVLLRSGIIGKIHSVEEHTLFVEIAPNVRIRVHKQAIQLVGGNLKALTEGSSADKVPDGSEQKEKSESKK